MTQLEKVLYTAKAHTTGGREGGSSRTDDGRLQVELSTPGSPGAGTNPEQLFAVGWSACFLSAIKLIAAKKRIALPPGFAVDAEVDLGQAQGGYHLAARLNVSLPGMDPETARSLVDGAHHICPYSLATSGNIDVTLNAITAASQPAGGRERNTACLKRSTSGAAAGSVASGLEHSETSFGPIRQVDAGLLNVGYVEAGPAHSPAAVLLHVVPVFGAAALAVAPWIGHIHVTVDDAPWHWVDASGVPVILNGLVPGRHRVLIELVNANHG